MRLRCYCVRVPTRPSLNYHRWRSCRRRASRQHIPQGERKQSSHAIACSSVCFVVVPACQPNFNTIRFLDGHLCISVINNNADSQLRSDQSEQHQHCRARLSQPHRPKCEQIFFPAHPFDISDHPALISQESFISRSSLPPIIQSPLLTSQSYSTQP